MSGHDPCCLYQGDGYEDSCEVCRTIEEARTNERERIAQALADLGYDYPAEVARSGPEGTP